MIDNIRHLIDGNRTNAEDESRGERLTTKRRPFAKMVGAGLGGVVGIGRLGTGEVAAQSGSKHRSVSPSDRTLGIGGAPPSDGTVLWDGEDHRLADHWEHTDGSDPQWHENEDFFEVNYGTGNIRSLDDIGDCHLHVEWRVPEDATGEEQQRGNSGVYVMGRYEVQVLDNYESPTYDWGWSGAKYGEATPMVSPLRPPGEWQSYDVLWRGPRWRENPDSPTGEQELVRPARVTVLSNGTVVLFNHRIGGETTFSKGSGEYNPHPPALPVQLQDHDNETWPQFRNIWYQPFPDVESNPVSEPTYTAKHTGKPAIVRAGGPGTADPASDAFTVLSDGSLDGWESVDGGSPGWRERDGYVEVEPGTGDIRTVEDIGDCQLHLEWRVPEGVDAETAARGSGVALMERYSLALGDPRGDDVESMKYAGAYPDQGPPRVDATRDGGEWQTLDVLWQGPRFDDGDLVDAARLTALVNGIVVQERLLPEGPNSDGSPESYEPHPVSEPLRLEDRGGRVQFRNVWYRRFEVTDEDGSYKNAQPHETALAYVDIARREVESSDLEP